MVVCTLTKLIAFEQGRFRSSGADKFWIVIQYLILRALPCACIYNGNWLVGYVWCTVIVRWIVCPVCLLAILSWDVDQSLVEYYPSAFIIRIFVRLSIFIAVYVPLQHFTSSLSIPVCLKSFMNNFVLIIIILLIWLKIWLGITSESALRIVIAYCRGLFTHRICNATLS